MTGVVYVAVLWRLEAQYPVVAVPRDSQSGYATIDDSFQLDSKSAVEPALDEGRVGDAQYFSGDLLSLFLHLEFVENLVDKKVLTLAQLCAAFGRVDDLFHRDFQLLSHQSCALLSSQGSFQSLADPESALAKQVRSSSCWEVGKLLPNNLTSVSRTR